MLEMFLKKNINLFVALAFFMALADFFNSKANSETGIKAGMNITLYLGVVSCIAISIIISFIVLKKLFQDPSGKHKIVNITVFNLDNVERFAFSMPFYIIMITLLYYIYETFTVETNVVINLSVYLISIPLYFQVFKINFFKAHLYYGSILIIIISTMFGNYILHNQTNNPLMFTISVFVTMSVLIIVVTLMRDARNRIISFRNKDEINTKKSIKTQLGAQIRWDNPNSDDTIETIAVHPNLDVRTADTEDNDAVFEPRTGYV
jgi:uncharacterized membrane protein YesL